MRAIGLAAALAVMLGVASFEAYAQPLDGTRVRVTAPSVRTHRFVATVVADPDESVLALIVGDSPTTVRIPRHAVEALELSRSRGRKGKGAGRGFLRGVLIGALVGYLVGDDCGRSKQLMCFQHQNTMSGGAVLFGAVGAAIGAWAAPGERWESVPVETLSGRRMPAGGRGLSLSLRF